MKKERNFHAPEEIQPAKFTEHLLINYLPPILAIFLALIAGGIFLLCTGHDPIRVFFSIFSNGFFHPYGLSETLIRSIPLSLCALGIALCLQASLWNIGAEGQMLAGCITSTWVALTYGNLPPIIVIPLTMVAGFAGGAIWSGIAGVLKSLADVNEILTTLLMNYIAIELLYYFVYGPWKDPVSNFPYSSLFSTNVWFPSIPWYRLHTGCFIPLLAAGIIYVLLSYTRLGFSIRILGDNPKAALYAGVKAKYTMLLTMIISGGLAGLAGTVELLGIEHKLHHNMAKGYGYTAIIIAWLAGKHPGWVLVVSIFMAGLSIGGEMAQIVHNIPLSTVHVLQATILFFILVSQVLKEKGVWYLSNRK